MAKRDHITKTPPRTVSGRPAGNKLTRIIDSYNIPDTLYLHRTIGNRSVQQLFKSGFIQAKLKLGEPNDIYEQEADRVAEQVMRMPEDSGISGQRSAIDKDGIIQLKPG